MNKNIFIFACLLIAGCAGQKSATWERVVNAPRTTSPTGNRSAVYAGGLHAELTKARVPHKVVTYNYPFRSKFDGAGTAQRTSVIYCDKSSGANPCWLMDEMLMRPVWLPTQPVPQQISFFLRRPAKVVTLREYCTNDGKAVAPEERKSQIAAVDAPVMETQVNKPWLVVRTWKKVVAYFTPQAEPVAQPEISEGPTKRPLFRPAGVKLRPLFAE